jgi:gliding motility-associated-like protein
LPANNATNVLVNANITWDAVATATGYTITINGMSIDVGNTTTYNPPVDFTQSAYYEIIVTPYNATGNASGCTLQSFFTETIATIPNCTTLLTPSNGSTNVAINSNILILAVSNATGYFISIGTTSGGTDFVNNLNVLNSFNYNPATNFNYNTTYFVTITPYNSAGNALSCSAVQFTTESDVVIPSCASIIFPPNASTDIAVSTSMSWSAVANATGYFISYGTNNAANNIENMVDVGNALSYNPPTNFPDEAQIFIVITPYNALGNATGCNLQYFETEVINIEISEETFFISSFFTPNADGYNDVWQITDPKNEVKLVYIYDRFGKLLKNISNNGNWNGTLNNQDLDSDDYWYVIEKKTGELLKGHFTLKR